MKIQIEVGQKMHMEERCGILCVLFDKDIIQSKREKVVLL